MELRRGLWLAPAPLPTFVCEEHHRVRQAPEHPAEVRDPHEVEARWHAPRDLASVVSPRPGHLVVRGALHVQRREELLSSRMLTDEDKKEIVKLSKDPMLAQKIIVERY